VLHPIAEKDNNNHSAGRARSPGRWV